jgi:hypothetical protein
MKNNIFKIFITCFFIMLDLSMFSQGDDTVDGDLEGSDAPPTPINGKLLLLAIAGIIYSVYIFRNSKKRIES